MGRRAPHCTTGLLKLSFARDVYQPDLQRVSLGGLGMTQLWAVPASAPRFDSVTPASTAAFSANAELYLR